MGGSGHTQTLSPGASTSFLRGCCEVGCDASELVGVALDRSRWAEMMAQAQEAAPDPLEV